MAGDLTLLSMVLYQHCFFPTSAFSSLHPQELTIILPLFFLTLHHPSFFLFLVPSSSFFPSFSLSPSILYSWGSWWTSDQYNHHDHSKTRAQRSRDHVHCWKSEDSCFNHFRPPPTWCPMWVCCLQKECWMNMKAFELSSFSDVTDCPVVSVAFSHFSRMNEFIFLWRMKAEDERVEEIGRSRGKKRMPRKKLSSLWLLLLLSWFDSHRFVLY